MGLHFRLCRPPAVVALSHMILRATLFTLLTAATLAVVQSAPPATSTENSLFQNVLLDVRKLATEQQYDQALARLNDAERIKPGSPIVQNARGSIYTSMKDYGKARECFKQAER